MRRRDWLTGLRGMIALRSPLEGELTSPNAAALAYRIVQALSRAVRLRTITDAGRQTRNMRVWALPEP